MYKWYLPTLSEVLAPIEIDRGEGMFAAQQRLQAEREWCGAIAALNKLLHARLQPPTAKTSCKPLFQGLVLAGPLPILETPELVASLSTWTFTVNPLGAATWMPFQLLPSSAQQAFTVPTGGASLSVMPNDPLAAEQFCLALTPEFSLVLVLGEDGQGNPAFLFSFDPDMVNQSWQTLRGRLLFTNPESLRELDRQVEKFAPLAPDYRLVSQFSRLMLANLPQIADWDLSDGDGKGKQVVLQDSVSARAVTREVLKPVSFIAPDQSTLVDSVFSRERETAQRNGRAKNTFASPDGLGREAESFDKELLQAIAHEVRTPLTTIRTLTRLLLKRKDLNPDVLKRLQAIDQECTEQIDRFNLFFKAVEVEKANTKQPITPLAPISLAQIFQQNVPRWQQQASQRNLTLEVRLPQKLPMVVTDPTMLDQVLSGLIDRIIHTLSPGSHIQVQVTLAGHQLKLQFESQPQANAEGAHNLGEVLMSPLKSLGQLLMFQPETGNLSLNLSVTKNLFQALGGKMTVKQRPQQGEVLTIFLPLETRRVEE